MKRANSKKGLLKPRMSFFLRKHIFIFWFWLGAFFISPNFGHTRILDSQAKGPLPTRTQNPIYLQFLAMPLERATTLNRRQFETEVSVTFSNIFELNLEDENYVADMELWRTAFNFRYGFTENLDVSLELAFLSQFGGFLDGFIDGYHNTFGFPNGGREFRSQNDFAFSLSQDGNSIFSYDQQRLGVSDSTLRFKYNLSKMFSLKKIKLATALAVKFPVGEKNAGLSSGHFDFGMSFFLEKNFKRLHLHSQLGTVFLGGHDDIDSFLRWGFVQFGQSVEYQLTNSLSALVQITGHTSGLKNFSATELSSPVVDLSIGAAGSVALKNSWADEFYYKFAFSEDITSQGPAIDFSLLFVAGLRY